MTLDEATDRLYAADLDAFVEERTRLAKELAAAGAKDDAAALRSLRKPTVAAWVLNQLARRRRRDVDLLLDAGHRLRQAQAGILGGGERESFETAREIQRDTLRRLAGEAEEILRERGGGSSAVLGQVAESLRAAAISEQGRELLARGRFVQPLRAEGFDVVSELVPSAPQPRVTEDQVRAAKEALREAKQRLRETERAATAAAERAERLRGEAETAERESRDAAAAAAAAREEVEEAERRLAEVSPRDRRR